ncbi:MAG: PP2C family protein-serine/threonine phosphatase [Thermoanaerobaculia bacterium]
MRRKTILCALTFVAVAGTAVNDAGAAQPAVDAVASAAETARIQGQIQAFFTALPLAFGLLHLILYIHLPRARANLPYSLWMFTWAVGVWADLQYQYVDQAVGVLRLHRATATVGPIVGLWFFYTLLWGRIPRQFYVLSGAVGVTGIAAVIDPSHATFRILSFVSLIVFLEWGRLLVEAVGRRWEGAALLLGGFACLMAFGAYDFYLDQGLMSPILGITNLYFVGYLGFFFTMSISLARDFAKQERRAIAEENRAAEEALGRRRAEAESARKGAEIEEARRLQIALLPSSVPDLDGFEIAVHTETATEVGGDYHDFLPGPDGSLTALIGDAAGHGLRAGVLVAVIKSLVSSHDAIGRDPARFLEESGVTLRRLDLDRIDMALAVLSIRGGTVRWSSAGMPPLLVRRALDGRVEEHLVAGPFLASRLGTTRENKILELVAGDVLLAYSDGLPESLGPDDESFGFRRLSDAVSELGSRPLREFLEQLMIRIETWRDGRDLYDDMSVIAFRRRDRLPPDSLQET